MNTLIFDRLLDLIENHFKGTDSLSNLSEVFTENETKELDTWIIALYSLMRKHDGLVDKMIEENLQRANVNPDLEEDLQMALHLKDVLDIDEYKLFRFEELVSTLEIELDRY